MSHVAFLSSRLLNRGDIREKIHEVGKPYGGIYVDEVKHPARQTCDPLEVVDELLAAIRDAELFICVLDDSGHGTPVEGSRVSYLEIELYQAALLQKDTLVLVPEEFTPGHNLGLVLRMLEFALPESAWLEYRDDTHTLSLITEALERRLSWSRRLQVGVRVGLKRFVTQMWRLRAAEAELHGGETPIRFLHAQHDKPVVPHIDKVERWLSRSRVEKNHERRLGRLWMAYRELSAARFDSSHFRSLAPLWNDLLSSWASAAAWYGLHAHMPLGRLAALKTLEEVRQVMRASPEFRSLHDAAHPAGSLASSHYSIAKLLMDRRGRRWHFDEARRQIELGLDESREQQDGLLAIRGSVNLYTGHFWEAVKDYKEVLELREARNAGDPSVGEAMSELGYAYLLTGRLFTGRRLIAEGIKLLEQHGERGFLLRAVRKMVMADILTGRFRSARRLRESARQLAAEHSIRDQDKWI